MGVRLASAVYKVFSHKLVVYIAYENESDCAYFDEVDKLEVGTKGEFSIYIKKPLKYEIVEIKDKYGSYAVIELQGDELDKPIQPILMLEHF